MTILTSTPVHPARGDLAEPLFSTLAGDVEVSFELFPPRAEAASALLATIEALAALRPRFFSVTYGAGGGTRDRTRDLVRSIARDTGLPAAHHLTCVGATRAEITATAEALWDDGVRHIVALRGDAAAGEERFRPHPDGYANAAELVAGLRAIAPFEISVGAYPDTHPEAVSAQSDLDNLKRKLDAGATRAITQFFFSAETFLRFRDRAAAAGITQEIVPGILPVASTTQVRRFARLCGASVPAWMDRLFEGLDGNPAACQFVGATLAAELCGRLHAGGVRQFHVYTLNRAEPALAICHLLGVRPASDAQPLRAVA
jgi:methylenetetrahydrofolate reductase (NADPH)